MGASSGLYWGIYAPFKFSFCIFFLTISERCIEVLSSITRQCSGSIPSLSFTNLTNSLKKSTIRIEVMLPFWLSAIVLPFEVLTIIKDHEFLKQIFLMICSFPFGIHERLFLISLEKEVSSMFISNLNLSIDFQIFMENHCLISDWSASSKVANLLFPFCISFLVPLPRLS